MRVSKSVNVNWKENSVPRYYCPRCESPLIFPEQQCSSCGYRWMVKCHSCNHPNVPKAVFCGKCGRGISLKTRLLRRWETLVSLPSRIRLKNLAAGFAFGGLLTTFALGTMGMSGPGCLKVEPVWEKSDSDTASTTTSSVSHIFHNRFQNWKDSQNLDREATIGDLIKIGNIMIEAFSSSLNTDEDSGIDRSGGSMRYLQSLGERFETPELVPLTRSEAALFLFRIADEIFDINASPDTEYKYTDVPRFHYMNIPIETLEKLGIQISRDPQNFGGDDKISLTALTKLSVSLVKIGEQRMKNKVFPTLDSRG